MRKHLAIGCLLSLVCQSQIFGSEAQTVIEKARYSRPSVVGPYVSAEESSYQDDADEEDLFQIGDEIADAGDYGFANGMPCKGKAEKPATAQSTPMLNQRVQIGGNYTWVSIHPHGSDSFTGNLGGVQGMYEYRPMDCFYGGAKLTWREGQTHGSSGKRSLVYVDAQERLGYTFSFENDDWLLTLYTGLGFRYYGQKFDPKAGSSMTFKYYEFYVPVGTMVDYAVNSWFAIGLGFAWMPQIYPTLAIVPLKGARWTITDQFANFYVELPFTFTLTCDKRFSLIVNPFYEYWRDGHTTAKTTSGVKLNIPGNTYNFGGVEVNFAYSF